MVEKIIGKASAWPALFIAIGKGMQYDMRIMKQVLNIYKPQGMTPLQALEAVRDQYPKYHNEKMSYAGRLDPMAEGVLVVLAGDAVHDKERYLKLSKTYEADIVFGIGTDTHDLLGIAAAYEIKNIQIELFEAEIRNMQGIFKYPFPIYASKPVNGKPLFQWAREGKLDEIEIPKRTMCVYGVELLDRYECMIEEIKNNAIVAIATVRGDFRQKEIANRWQSVFTDINKKTALSAVRIRIHCASGTYIRTLAHELGKRLGADAIVTRLIRTRVGEFKIEDSMRLY